MVLRCHSNRSEARPGLGLGLGTQDRGQPRTYQRMERWDRSNLAGFWEVGGGLRGGRSPTWGHIGVCETRIKSPVNIVR